MRQTTGSPISSGTCKKTNSEQANEQTVLRPTWFSTEQAGFIKAEMHTQPLASVLLSCFLVLLPKGQRLHRTMGFFRQYNVTIFACAFIMICPQFCFPPLFPKMRRWVQREQIRSARSLV